MSPAAFAAALLDRGIEITLRNDRLRLWPAKAYHTLTADERVFIRHYRAELKALAREGLTTLPDANPETQASAIARLRRYDEAAASMREATPTSHGEQPEQRLSWDERAQVFVKDLGITI